MTQPALVRAVVGVIEALDALHIEYYVGGSVVSSVYGVGRSTNDIDLCAALRPDQAEPLHSRIVDAYYADLDTMRDAIRRHSMFNAIHLETSFKVDVYVANTKLDRTTLARKVRDRLVAEPDSPTVSLASAEDVVLHKLSWYRDGGGVSERQWGDILGVLRVQGDSLDRAYMDEWAAELGIADLLARARKEAGLE